VKSVTTLAFAAATSVPGGYVRTFVTLRVTDEDAVTGPNPDPGPVAVAVADVQHRLVSASAVMSATASRN
jgi:hypothetical protein